MSSEESSSDDDVIPSTVVFDCPSKKAYLESNNSKKVLFVMCLGLKKDEKPLFNLDSPPWNTMESSHFKLKREDFTKEVVRRAAVQKIDNPPRPTNWTITRSMEWLESHPREFPEDVTFLTKEVNRLGEVLNDLATEAQEANSISNGAWRGDVPYMRLIFCLVEDDIKMAYLRRAEALTRLQLDYRSSDQRAETVFEMIAKRWNDNLFNPIAPTSTCHSKFSFITDCSYPLVSSLLPATPEKVENCLTNMRSQLLRIIADWMRSGQGEGGNVGFDEGNGDNGDEVEGMVIADDPESSNYGSLENRSAAALQNRASFLRGKPPYLLYFWEILDKNGMLSSTLQRLDDSVSAMDGASAPSVSFSSVKRRKRSTVEDEEQQHMQYYFRLLSENDSVKGRRESVERIRSRIASLKSDKRTVEEKYLFAIEENKQARADLYLKQMEGIDQEIQEEIHQLTAIDGESQASLSPKSNKK